MKYQQHAQQRQHIGGTPQHNPQFSGVPTNSVVGGPVHQGRMHMGTILTYAAFFYGGWFVGKGGLKKFLK
jgi:hypothetical protein